MNDGGRMKVMTIVGTRPEIIRLAPTIKALDQVANHVLVHTGQNYDYELNEIFFRDLNLRAPDHFLGADTSSVAAVLGSVLVETEKVLLSEKPDALVILGDTNSSIAALISKRMKIPVFHMEAGNRSFDENVPEEINRRLVDHVSDYNLVYTEHARRNLLAEGIHPSRILLTGSPMREVLDGSRDAIAASDVLEREALTEGGYFMVSLHREENVDSAERLSMVLVALNELRGIYDIPILISTHPRTRKRLEAQPDHLKSGLRWSLPFGFNDYIALQASAKLVLSDSGTISEEAALLGFPAVTLRDAIERPEAIETGGIVTAGVTTESIVDSVRIVLHQFAQFGAPVAPPEYLISDSSRRVVNFIRSTVGTHHERAGIRRATDS